MVPLINCFTSLSYLGTNPVNVSYSQQPACPGVQCSPYQAIGADDAFESWPPKLGALKLKLISQGKICLCCVPSALIPSPSLSGGFLIDISLLQILKVCLQFLSVKLVQF